MPVQPLTFTVSFTITNRLDPTTLPAAYTIAQNFNPGENAGWSIFGNGSVSQCIQEPSGSFTRISANWSPSAVAIAPLADTNYIVVTFDGTALRTYCNGCAMQAWVLGAGEHGIPGTINPTFDPSVASVSQLNYALTLADVVTAYAARGTTSGPASSSMTGSAYYNAILGDNPACYFRCDEDPGSTGAIDRGPANIPAAYLNGPLAFDVPGALPSDTDYGVHFEGTTSHASGLSIAYNQTGSGGTFSCECWVEIATLPPSFSYPAALMASGNDVASSGFKLALYSTGQIKAWVPTTGVEVDGPTLSAGSYHYLVMTYDGTTLTLYVDGAPYRSTSGSVAGSVFFTGNLTAAVYANGGYTDAGTFMGAMDEIAFYTYALSAAQVAAHWNAAQGSTVTPPTYAVVNDDRHYFDVRIYDKNGVLLEVPHEDIEAFDLSDVLNGGSATGTMTFRRPFNQIGALSYLNRVQVWVWHGRIARPVNPWWSGYMLEPDQMKTVTGGQIVMHCEGDQKLLDRGIVDENINPNVSGNPSLDAADYLRHLCVGAQAYTDPSFGSYAIPATMFPLQPMQFQEQKLGAVIDTVVKSGRTSLGQMWTWFVRSDYLLRRTLTFRADANPNKDATYKFQHIIAADDCVKDGYTVNTRYRDITNVVVVKGGKDETTGQNAIGDFVDGGSVAAFGAWQAAISVPSLRSADACRAYGEAYLDMYANPQAEGTAILKNPDPAMLAGVWVQFWELASVIKQVRIGQVRCVAKPGRIEMTLSTTAPTPYLDEAVYKLGQNTANAISSAVRSLPVNTQQNFVRLGGSLS